MERSHYQVLGVSPTASTEQIRRAYRQLAYLLHPDRQGDATAAEQRLADRRMREVNAAWTTLSDPAKRSDYDHRLAASSRSATTTTATRPPTSDASTDRPAPEGWWDTDDPDAAFARARLAELDPDEPELSAGQFWLLRRGPVVVILAVAAVLFVFTAYAARGTDANGNVTSSTVAPPVVANSKCVKLMSDNMAYTVSCDGGYDATIVREEPDVRSCLAEDLEYAVVGNKSVCIRPQ